MSKVGRNNPCPCGSGKKYKRCCVGTIDRAPVTARIANPSSPAAPGALPEAVKAAFERGRTESAAIEAAALAAEVMDQGLARAWGASPRGPACSRGCNYCCSIRVSVTIPEVARTIAYAREHLSPEAMGRVEARARENAPQTHGATALRYPQLDCAFLGVDGECQVYDARPLACRREHSLDVAECRTGYERFVPGTDYPIPHAVPPMMIGDVVWEASRIALTAADVDASHYELQEALAIAFSTPDAVSRWLRHEALFEAARLNETHEDGEIQPQLVELRTRGKVT